MADQSIYATILDAVALKIGGLELIFNNKSVPVQVTKLPKKEKTLDTLPLVVVSPSDKPEIIEPFTTEDEVLTKYQVECVFIAGGNRDFTETNLDAWLTFRQQIRQLFQFGIDNINLPTGVDLFFSEILPDAPLDRSGLNKMYEYSGIRFRFWVSEPRD